jgi:hypothetical protein
MSVYIACSQCSLLCVLKCMKHTHHWQGRMVTMVCEMLSCIAHTAITPGHLLCACRTDVTPSGPGSFAAGHTPQMLTFVTPSPAGAPAAPPAKPHKGARPSNVQRCSADRPAAPAYRIAITYDYNRMHVLITLWQHSSETISSNLLSCGSVPCSADYNVTRAVVPCFCVL